MLTFCRFSLRPNNPKPLGAGAVRSGKSLQQSFSGNSSKLINSIMADTTESDCGRNNLEISCCKCMLEYVTVGCNRTPSCVDWGRNGWVAYGACYSIALCRRKVLFWFPRATKPTCTNYTLSFSLCSPIVSVMSCRLKTEKVNSTRQSLARF